MEFFPNYIEKFNYIEFVPLFIGNWSETIWQDFIQTIKHSVWYDNQIKINAVPSKNLPVQS